MTDGTDGSPAEEHIATMSSRASNFGENFFHGSLFAVLAFVTYVGSIGLLIR